MPALFSSSTAPAPAVAAPVAYPTPEGIAGSGPSFEALFQSHRAGLQSFLYRKLGNREDAEDAVTLTFYKAWRARESFRGEIPERAWLFGIANRVAIDYLRRRRCRPVGCSLEADLPEVQMLEAGEENDPAHHVLESERVSETRDAIQDALGRLPDEQRQLLNLYYFEGRPYGEISSLLGIPYHELKSRLYRIRQRVRRDLSARYAMA